MPDMSQTSAAASRRRDLALSVAIGFALVAAVASIVYAPTGLVVPVFGTIGYTVVGAVILRRRPGNGIGRLALAIGLAYSISAIVLAAVRATTPEGAAFPIVPGSVMLLVEAAVDASEILQAAALAIGTILLVTFFPSGRRSSRLGAVVELGVVVIVVSVAILVLEGPLFRTFGWSPALGTIVEVAQPLAMASLVVTWVLAIVDLLRRYRKAGPVERVQMRWLVASIVASTLLVVLLAPFGGADSGLWDAWILTAMLPVVAIAIAITRYRLYDIDRIVSRSITYAVITVVLFGIFAAVNLLLAAAVGGVVGDAPVIVAISTLVVAALFDPLRTRVQRVVDLRFHRAHYDSERTVATYAGRLREELDLQTLVGELERTAVSAVEPARTDVWLRPSADRAT